MNSFYYYNPTKIIFGAGMIERLKNELPKRARVLLVYGSGSIKSNGVYDQVVQALQEVEYFEFGGITPNPEYRDCIEASSFAKEHDVNFLLAVGGGSVIDAVKFISLCMCDASEEGGGKSTPWDFLTGDKPKPSESIPFGCVLTAPATGSEINSGCVISDSSKELKLVCDTWHTYPKFSVIDPTVAMTLPERQIANGVVDSFVHVLEQYATSRQNSLLQDRQAEAILLTVKEVGPKLVADKTDVHAWEALSWCASQAMSGLISRGVTVDWSTHHIAHHLTAVYGLDHAVTLAIVLPGVWEFQLGAKLSKLAQYGRRVWGLTGTEEEVARQAIKCTEDFFNELGVSSRFGDYGINAFEAAQSVTQRFTDMSTNLGENHAIDQTAIQQILESRR